MQSMSHLAWQGFRYQGYLVLFLGEPVRYPPNRQSDSHKRKAEGDEKLQGRPPHSPITNVISTMAAVEIQNAAAEKRLASRQPTSQNSRYMVILPTQTSQGERSE
jgi:hypothetical protein